MKITVKEELNFYRQDISDYQLFTYNLESGGYYTFRYTNPELIYNTTITLTLKDLSSASAATPTPYIYYKVCETTDINDCYLSEEEAAGFNVT